MSKEIGLCIIANLVVNGNALVVSDIHTKKSLSVKRVIIWNSWKIQFKIGAKFVVNYLI